MLEDVRSTDDDRLRISIRNAGGDLYWAIHALDIATAENLPQAVSWLGRGIEVPRLVR